MVYVVVDDREHSAALEYLKEKNAEIVTKRLRCGDYVVSGRVGIERKTSHDFENSIIDGRLFHQVEELRQNFQIPLLAVVGNNFERISLNAVRGALISIIVNFRVQVIFFSSEKDFANFLFMIAQREQESNKREIKLRFEKKNFSLSQQQQFIVESLPSIGPKKAKALLRHFKTLYKIFNASEKQLQKINGIGEMRARKIYKIIHSKFEE